MDTAHWPQMVVKPIEEIVVNTSTKHGGGGEDQRKARPQKESALNCPRCHSTNTKFCYYNNYSLTQPRYFCKTCRRYWTEGGSLRNIPVGGGSRKNKTTPNNKNLPDLLLTQTTHPNSNSTSNPNINHHVAAQNLNLAIPELLHQNNNMSASSLELLSGNGITSSRGLNSCSMPLMPPEDPNTCGFPSAPEDFKPTLNFSLDGINSGRLFFPLEDLKSTILENHHQEQQNINKRDSTGYWTGMLQGGSGSNC